MTDYQAYARHRLLPFQRRVLKAAQPGNARLTIFTGGRGIGKTYLAGLVAAADVVEGGEVVAVAAAQHQARRLMTDCRDALAFRFGEGIFGSSKKHRFRLVDTQQLAAIDDKHTGGSFRAVGSNPKTLQGLRSTLALMDEPAQWYPSKATDLFNTLIGGLGKTGQGRAMIFGTRPAFKDHFYQRLLDADPDPDVRIFRYEAKADESPWTLKQVRRANPLIDYLDIDFLKFQRRQAKKDPVAEASWLSQVLNLGVPNSPQEGHLIAADEWATARSLPEVARQGPLIIAFDAGLDVSLSACIGFWPMTGRVEVRCLVGSTLTLDERGKRDGVEPGLYLLAEREGGLRQTATAFPDVRVLLEQALTEWGQPYRVTSDRYRKQVTDLALEAFGWSNIYVPLSPGGRDGADVVATFRQELLDGFVRPSGPVRLLDYAASVARLRTLEDGRQVLETRKSKGTGIVDDPVAALLLAVYVGKEVKRKPLPRPSRFLGWA